MKIYYGTDNLPDFEHSVITIGSFDGLHHGHRSILSQVVNKSKEIQGTSVLITFAPHPRHFLNPDSDFKLISDNEEKANLVEKSGIEHLVVIPFDAEFANQSPQAYIKDFLVQYFNPSVIIIGYDHRFGKKRLGDISLLLKYQEEFDYKVEEITEQTISEVAVSSTKIRKALQSGNIELANAYLGYKYTLSGVVEHGDEIGRQINFPTANIRVENKYKLIPSNGVYSVKVNIDNNQYKGMMHIGLRPSIENQDLRLEVHIFDFEDTIYDQKITIEFQKRIRDNKKFDNLDLLKLQLEKDKLNCLNA